MKIEEKIGTLIASAGLLAPLDILANKKHITIKFPGDNAGLAGVVTSILQENEINYLDPTPGTADVYVSVIPHTFNTVMTIIKCNRMDKKTYETILDTAVDLDGDGTLEIPDAES